MIKIELNLYKLDVCHIILLYTKTKIEMSKTSVCQHVNAPLWLD